MATIIKVKDGRTMDLDLLAPKVRKFYEKAKANLLKHYGINFDEYITSGHRTPAEDKAAGGSGSGRHTKGEGLDVSPNGIIYKYLWNTDEGLSLLEDAGLGLYNEVDHYHFGGDTYESPQKDEFKGVVKPKERREELKLEGADSETPLLTPEQVAYLDPDYTDIEKVKQELYEKSLTPEEKALDEKAKGLEEKYNTFVLKQQAYNKAKDPVSGGLKSTIEKTKKEYDDATVDLGVDIQNISLQNHIAKYKKAKEDIEKYEPGSVAYEEAVKMLDFYENGRTKGLIGYEPSPLNGVLVSESTGRDGKSKKVIKDKLITEKDIRKTIATGEKNYKKGAGMKKSDFPIYENFIESLDKKYQEISEKNIIPNRVTQEQVIEEQAKRLQNKEEAKLVEDNILDAEGEAQRKRVEKQAELDEQQKREAQAKIDQEIQTKKDAVETAEKVKALDQQATDYFSRFTEPVEPILPETFAYDNADYKKPLPLEALGYGALALSGLADANTKSPLREDNLSQAIIQYTADLKQMSEQGLKPEEEAKLKDGLTSMYAEGMTQLTRASQGNRNVILGNMGSLQNSKMRALTEMSIADINIKQQNFEKYGEMIKTIQDFRTKKEIDNHNIKLDDAREKRQGGAALASSGFAAMLEELQYQKENGPGSANHRLNKSFEVFLTGIDSDRVDPGDGSRPYTKSWQDQRIATLQDNYAKSNEVFGIENQNYSNFINLPADEKLKHPSYTSYLQSLNEPKPLNQNYTGSGFMGTFGR